MAAAGLVIYLSLGSGGESLHLWVGQVDADHGLPEPRADVGQDVGVAVVRDGLDDGAGAARRVAALEDAGADEDAVAAELHHERGVGGRGDSPRGELDDGEAAQLLGLHDEVVRRGDALGVGEDLVVVHVAERADVAHDGADVAHGLDDVARAGLPLGADHGGALADAAQRLPEVAAAAHEGDAEVVLVDVVRVVGERQHLALVHVVHADGLQDLGLHEVADARLGHDRDGDGALDVADEPRVGHARHAALRADVGGDALQRHDGAGPGLLGDARLLRRDDVHDDAAAQHLRQAHLDGEGGRLRLLGGLQQGGAVVAVDGDHAAAVAVGRHSYLVLSPSGLSLVLSSWERRR
ncbi:hypothetical protein GQ55_2G000300 [Panicum hallii var. hallii]|uniref:Uncharacterized protein n=1 Tax=Panicum hallii var. hallii TaxID=1504633 RepID=A0A2T7EJX9_9POAL|nr:hypothetical protein GQ55_2G000300 [Panicum hallii var. hallii]